MSFGEDVLALHAQADEVVDVEEAPVAELLVGGLPVGEAVVLLREEVVEGVGVGVDRGDGLVDGFADGCVFVAEAVEHGLDDLLVAVTGEDGGAVLERGGGEPEEGGGDKGEGVRLRTAAARIRMAGMEVGARGKVWPAASMRKVAALRVSWMPPDSRTLPYWSPRTGTSTLSRRRASWGFQSMSKKPA